MPEDPAPANGAHSATSTRFSFTPDDLARGGPRHDDAPRYWLADASLMRSLPPAAWTLFRLAEYKRGGTAAHMWRVGALTWRFAQSLGMPAIRAQALGLAAALHDTGKLCIPNAILEKPGRLTAEEMRVMRAHPQLGADVLSAIGGAACELASTVARSHHERYDGRGYPYGLSGNRIPLAGRIVALVDVFDALASHRPYRTAWSPAKIVGAMLAERGRHFDPWLLDRFLERSLGAALQISSGAR
ncbi:HD domain-containing protein [Pandoraea nosoerga]|uniref:Response regulator receiver n=1 Tax=Pandoraea nosoerga TaxID=2508296 RepID=A0A5E4WST0_9BURK|nr:HD domain-containing phosphohydrolase [Pandoraea nosoerga]MBN4666368.1 HD domain-containing protein [Pandoraea nosoerga]MBN4675953.1 HD domain-containing protein [Pandoraea nosoerga]MBN4682048.1 HD domain-containing protein [Pandoraea nosoerga]MBN4746438.1 HD domain-containing protein [Pandoraea nosoerga]VVE27878.1 response regulator receiver [Pandoraea nosoerga]